MRIAFGEIWSFVEMMDGESSIDYSLVAGKVRVEGLQRSAVDAIKHDEDYDQELLPSLFTFREILWQPQVFTEVSMAFPAIRILKGFCEETSSQLKEDESATNSVYCQLMQGMAQGAQSCLEALDAQIPVVKALRQLRLSTFPIIKFFIHHPRNRTDHHKDAVNRLNYAVKIMLTQFHGQYSELEDPYWVLGEPTDDSRATKKSASQTTAD